MCNTLSPLVDNDFCRAYLVSGAVVLSHGVLVNLGDVLVGSAVFSSIGAARADFCFAIASL
jgi:hypothetical protein